jgi:hypothetical protein
MSVMGDAVDVVYAALAAATFAIPVTVSKTPMREWKVEDLRDTCAVQVEGTSTGYEVDDRSGALSVAPDVSVTIISRIGSTNGQPNNTTFAEAEAVADTALTTVRQAVLLDSRWALVGVDRPVRYDQEQLRSGRVFMTEIVFSLLDTNNQ